MQLIISKNFDARGHVDLIDWSITPDGLGKNLLAHCNCGMKLANSRLLVSRNSIVVAHALLLILSITGLPNVFQRSNASKLLNIIKICKTVHFVLEKK